MFHELLSQQGETLFWMIAFAYFVGSTVALTVAGELYALLLRSAAARFPTMQLPLGILLYLAFSGTFVISLGGLQWITQQGTSLSESEMGVGLLAWFLSMIAAVTFFHRRHHSVLQKLGYFQPRD